MSCVSSAEGCGDHAPASAKCGALPSSSVDMRREKARMSRTLLILWHAHQNDVASVRKLLEEDRSSLVHARDYDNRTPLHVASLRGWIDVSRCLVEFGADVNAQDCWKNTGSFGEILKAYWRGTPVAVKRILPSLSDYRLVIQDLRHGVNLLVKLRHPNIVQFLGAVTDKKPLKLITEYLRGYLMEKGALSPSTAINFALDIARGMTCLHSEPHVIIHRDLKPRNVLLVNPSADHLKVGLCFCKRTKSNKHLTVMCWDADMNQRPSFLEILNEAPKDQGKPTFGSSLEPVQP